MRIVGLVAGLAMLVSSAGADVIKQGLETGGGTNALAAYRMEQVKQDDGTVVVRVSAEGTEQVRGYGFILNFDPARYEYVESRESSRSLLPKGSGAPLFLARNHEPGRVAIGAMSTSDDAGVGEGNLAEIVFRPIEGQDPGAFSLSEGVLVDLALKVDDVSPVTLEAVSPTPTHFALDQNRPNPFNPTTTISYQIPEAGQVKLTVFSSIGQVVRTLVDEARPAGTYTVNWDGSDAFGRQVASGLYFYRMQGDGFSQTRRMMLLK